MTKTYTKEEVARIVDELVGEDEEFDYEERCEHKNLTTDDVMQKPSKGVAICPSCKAIVKVAVEAYEPDKHGEQINVANNLQLERLNNDNKTYTKEEVARIVDECIGSDDKHPAPGNSEYAKVRNQLRQQQRTKAQQLLKG